MEKNKPLELDSSDSEDDQPVLIFKKKSHKKQHVPIEYYQKQFGKINENITALLAKNSEIEKKLTNKEKSRKKHIKVVAEGITENSLTKPQPKQIIAGSRDVTVASCSEVTCPLITKSVRVSSILI